MVSLNLLALTLIVVYITDLSGIIDSVKWSLGKWLNITVVQLKPFDCSLCMTWWCGLIYILCVGECRLITIAYVALLSLLSFNLAELLTLLKDTISLAINKLREKLWKQ